MKTKRSTNDILAEAEKIRQKLDLSCSQIQNYLFYQYLELVNKPKFSLCFSGSQAHVSQEFKRAYSTLTYDQKASHYLMSLKIVEQLMKQMKEDKCSTVITQQQTEKIKVYIRTDSFIKEWCLVNVQINVNTQTMKLSTVKEQIDLQCYIFRISKCKTRQAFALESIQKFCFPITIRMGPQKMSEFDLLSEKFAKYCQIAMKQKLKRMLKKSKLPNTEKRQKKIGQYLDAPKTLEFVNSNRQQSLKSSLSEASHVQFSMEEYTRISANLVSPELLKCQINFKDINRCVQEFSIIKKNNRVKKVFILEENQTNLFWFSQQLFQFDKFKVWQKSLFMVSFLAQFPQQKTKIFHQISVFKDGTESDFVFLRHLFNRDQVLYYIDKSISTIQYGSHESSASRGKIEFCLWRIKKIENGKIQLVVEAQMSYIRTKNIKQAIDQQIGQIQLINPVFIERKSDLSFKTNQFGDVNLEQISSSNNTNEPQRGNTVQQMNQLFQQMDESDGSVYYSIAEGQSDDEERGKYEQEIKTKDLDIQSFKKRPSAMCIPVQDNQKSPTQSKSLMNIQSLISNEIKTIRYQTSPTPKQKAPETPIGYTFFQPSEWISNEKGQLVNVNHEKIQAQSSVLSSILKQLSKNLFSGKSILNVCMPIKIFGTDSNLQKLCKGMAYAPIFLERAAKANNPLDRLLNTFLFSLGCSILYIEMSKPFNPILGETYQGFIDGCPVYGEQISHHPPISALFLQGRGYFVHSQLEAKVEMGLNSASGINAGHYTVAFHDSDCQKHLIKFTGPPGQMSGMVYGERKLIFIKKTQIYSVEDKLFCQIYWGKHKGNDEISKFNDYFYGKIGKIKDHINDSDFTTLKESDISQVVGVLKGRWTDTVFFNDHPIFKINDQVPYNPVQEPHPLESNCLFRKDMILRKQQLLEEAQTAKEEMEILQRNDQKLRQEN